MLAGIVRLQLDRIGRRIRDNHGAAFAYDEAVVEAIVGLCNDPASGGRMIDNILTNRILPDLSRRILKQQIDKQDWTTAHVGVGEDGQFSFAVS